MMSSEETFTMVLNSDRITAVDLLLYGKPDKTTRPNGWKFRLNPELPVRSTSHSLLYAAINNLYPDTEWLGLSITTSPAVALVAKIPGPDGRVLVWRNGWNRGAYNYLIYKKKQFYHRMNMTDTLGLLKILLSKREDMPRDTCKENLTLVMDRLKGKT